MKLSFCYEAHAWIEFFLLQIGLEARLASEKMNGRKKYKNTIQNSCYATIVGIWDKWSGNEDE